MITPSNLQSNNNDNNFILKNNNNLLPPQMSMPLHTQDEVSNQSNKHALFEANINDRYDIDIHSLNEVNQAT